MYININKHNHSEKYQFHFESKQFMDKNDRSIDIYTFFEEYPKLEDFYDENTKYKKPCKPDENGLLIYTGGEVFDKENVKKVIIEDGVTEIGEWAFSHCTNLTNITIPNSVTSIGGCAFYECKSLKSINIPNSVTYIGDNAFEHCRNLTITCEKGSYADRYAQDYDIPVKYM